MKNSRHENICTQVKNKIIDYNGTIIIDLLYVVVQKIESHTLTTKLSYFYSTVENGNERFFR